MWSISMHVWFLASIYCLILYLNSKNRDYMWAVANASVYLCKLFSLATTHLGKSFSLWYFSFIETHIVAEKTSAKKTKTYTSPPILHNFCIRLQWLATKNSILIWRWTDKSCKFRHKCLNLIWHCNLSSCKLWWLCDIINFKVFVIIRICFEINFICLLITVEFRALLHRSSVVD